MVDDKVFLNKWDIITYMEDEHWQGNLKDYKVGGVWALFGKEKANKNDDWFCLQVAKTRNIAEEIRQDIVYLKIKIYKEGEKKYINQFGEKMFGYTACEIEKSNIREVEYSDVMKKYKDLVFICICKENDKTKRTGIERYFAWNAHALYWRNGRPYKNEKNYLEKELNETRKDIVEKIDLTNNIKKHIDLFWNSPEINNKFNKTVGVCNLDCPGK